MPVNHEKWDAGYAEAPRLGLITSDLGAVGPVLEVIGALRSVEAHLLAEPYQRDRVPNRRPFGEVGPGTAALSAHPVTPHQVRNGEGDARRTYFRATFARNGTQGPPLTPSRSAVLATPAPRRASSRTSGQGAPPYRPRCEPAQRDPARTPARSPLPPTYAQNRLPPARSNASRAHHGQTTSEKISTFMYGSTPTVRPVFRGTLGARSPPRASSRHGPRGRAPRSGKRPVCLGRRSLKANLVGFRVPGLDRVEVGLREDRPDDDGGERFEPIVWRCRSSPASRARVSRRRRRSMQEFGSISVPGIAPMSNDMAMTFDKVPVQPGVPENPAGPAKPEDPQQLTGDVDALWEAVKALQQQMQALQQTLSQTQQQLNRGATTGRALEHPRAQVRWWRSRHAESNHQLGYRQERPVK